MFSRTQGKRTDSEQGFTLIEVTLAIVIGVVVIAGATVLFQQAKNGAGNARMQTKLASVAAMLEELTAKNYGRYPTADQLRGAYARQRPDDHLVSPWGGPVGQFLLGSNYRGLDSDNLDADSQTGDATRLFAHGTLDAAGGISYYLVTGMATASIYDKTREGFVPFRAYAGSGINAKNEIGWGVIGPKP